MDVSALSLDEGMSMRAKCKQCWLWNWRPKPTEILGKNRQDHKLIQSNNINIVLQWQ